MPEFKKYNTTGDYLIIFKMTFWKKSLSPTPTNYTNFWPFRPNLEYNIDFFRSANSEILGIIKKDLKN